MGGLIYTIMKIKDFRENYYFNGKMGDHVVWLKVRVFVGHMWK